jgi:hypothetical protein
MNPLSEFGGLLMTTQPSLPDTADEFLAALHREALIQVNGAWGEAG